MGCSPGLTCLTEFEVLATTSEGHRPRAVVLLAAAPDPDNPATRYRTGVVCLLLEANDIAQPARAALLSVSQFGSVVRRIGRRILKINVAPTRYQEILGVSFGLIPALNTDSRPVGRGYFRFCHRPGECIQGTCSSNDSTRQHGTAFSSRDDRFLSANVRAVSSQLSAPIGGGGIRSLQPKGKYDGRDCRQCSRGRKVGYTWQQTGRFLPALGRLPNIVSIRRVARRSAVSARLARSHPR